MLAGGQLLGADQLPDRAGFGPRLPDRAERWTSGIFDRLRRGRWWRAPLISSLAGSLIDTGLFFSIAFAGALAFLDPADPNGWAREAVPLFGVGPEAPLWVSLAIADLGVKLGMAALALLPFRLLTARLAA
ncbi:MAG: hypothetical protein KatS3mg118_3178 [Paracoccaceae bacterium]|nr:MAG: hypothetical protein KatS3mg118_3178 [Paracoccaceae bacterium]